MGESTKARGAPQPTWDAHHATEPHRPETIEVAGTIYARHPLSSYFPRIRDCEFNALVKSIVELGQLRPILLLPENVVLDGWNRLRACGAASKVPLFTDIQAGENLVHLTIALNLRQRHLTVGQRSLICAQMDGLSLDGLPQGRPAPSRRGDESPYSSNGPSATAPIASGTPKRDASSKMTTRMLAAQFAVSADSIYAARKVLSSAAPQVIDALRSGEISLNAAAEIARGEREASEHSRTNRTYAHKPHTEYPPRLSRHLWARIEANRCLPEGEDREAATVLLRTEVLELAKRVLLVVALIKGGDLARDEPEVQQLRRVLSEI